MVKLKFNFSISCHLCFRQLWLPFPFSLLFIKFVNSIFFLDDLSHHCRCNSCCFFLSLFCFWRISCFFSFCKFLKFSFSLFLFFLDSFYHSCNILIVLQISFFFLQSFILKFFHLFFKKGFINWWC